MNRTPDFLRAMDEISETTDQTGAMLALLMRHLIDTTEGGEQLSDDTLLNYVWALKAQNERTGRAIKAISQATAPAAA